MKANKYHGSDLAEKSMEDFLIRHENDLSIYLDDIVVRHLNESGLSRLKGIEAQAAANAIWEWGQQPEIDPLHLAAADRIAGLLDEQSNNYD